METWKAAEKYRSQGWTAPFPLPKGEKFPPPRDITGNIPALTDEEIDALWDGVVQGRNLGLRLQPFGEWEVISIDIDQYGDKRGADRIKELEAQLGSLSLESVPRSTRRGVNSPSAQYFFAVPSGIKWKANPCADVEVVQMTHRYAAVWPSVVEGMPYLWYLADEEIDVPHVEDLPRLPENWENYLRKTKISGLTKERKTEQISTRSDSGYRQAINWLRDNIPGWDTNEHMSQSLEKVSNSQDFIDNLKNNGHDTMVSAIHAAVMLGVEGHLGLKAALSFIKKNFIWEMTTRKSNGRSEATALGEYQSAVVGEVNRLMEEMAEGNVEVVSYGADLAMPGFHDLLVRSEASKRPVDVDLSQYSNTDLGHAQMFRDYWGRDVLTVSGGNSEEEFAIWTPSEGRFHFRSKKRVYGFMDAAISKRIDHEAYKLMEQGDKLSAAAEGQQLEHDEQDPDDLYKQAANLKKRANDCRQTSVRRNILEQMHGFDDSNISIDSFDSVEHLIGLKGGEVLDLESLKLGEEEFVRNSRQSDLITKSTAVPLVPGAKSKAWNEFLDDFLPDKDLRRFVQKAIGYSLVAGNPDKKIIFLYGPSNTGKTTILEAVARALGDYAGPMNAIKLFSGSNAGGPSPEMVESLNKRMVFMAEVGDDHALSANAVKRVTGNDSQQTRQLHSNIMRNAAPKFTPYVSTNSVPQIKGVDSAAKERLLVIPFTHAHPRKRITPDNDLKEEGNLASILWWVVEGCKMYLDEGMDPKDWPLEVQSASSAFSSDTSPIQGFLEDNLERTDGKLDRILVQDLYGVWESFCISQRIDRKDIGSVDEFRKRVAGNGWEVERGTVNGKRNQWFIRYAKLKA